MLYRFVLWTVVTLVQRTGPQQDADCIAGDLVSVLDARKPTGYSLLIAAGYTHC